MPGRFDFIFVSFRAALARAAPKLHEPRREVRDKRHRSEGKERHIERRHPKNTVDLDCKAEDKRQELLWHREKRLGDSRDIRVELLLQDPRAVCLIELIILAKEALKEAALQTDRELCLGSLH